MAISAMTVVSIPVADQAAARDFYVNLLGFELLFDEELSDGPGERWVRVAPTRTGPALSLVSWFDSMPPGSLQGMVLETTDIGAEYERLSKLGVRFDGAPRLEPWGANETILFDPDGNQLVLQESGAPVPGVGS
jgi:catechol 2,3-dioxygenase-like lactoylglutathione lyase family enzyme